MLVPFMGTEVAKLFDWEQQQQRHDWKFGGKKELLQICQLYANNIFYFEMNRGFSVKWELGAHRQNFYRRTANGL